MTEPHVHVFEPLFGDDPGEGLGFCSGYGGFEVTHSEAPGGTTTTSRQRPQAHTYIAIGHRGELVREFTHIYQVPMGRDYRDGRIIRTWIGGPPPLIRFRADGTRKDKLG